MEMPIPELSLCFILFSIYVLATVDQLVYYWLVFGKLAFYKSKKRNKKPLPVSVVICARNQDYNLRKYLPKILEQDYPDFEVVVVNDASTDDTLQLLKDFEREYSNLSIVNIEQNLNFFSGKKFALALGIKSAKHELLLLTDADCEPNSNQWIKQMASTFTSKTEIVLGYSPINPAKGFLNTLVRFDNFQTGVHYLSLSLIGKTSIGVGRNLAYRKSLFYKSGGFISQYKLQTGDDDLFINRVATKNNVRVEINHESFMHASFIPSFLFWFRKKQQQINTGKFYKTGTKFLRGKFRLSLLAFYGLLAALLIINYSILFVLGMFVLRLLTQLVIIKKCSSVLSERNLLLISPLLEISLVFILIAVKISNIFIKQNRWK